jgi:bifunctional ADP-heptose synthase (sugar kinase/adenylyltransferase)
MKVLVIGESCDDVFIYGEVLRLSPEAPVPVIKPLREVYSKGMAENVDDFDLVVFADYNKGFLSKSDILEISSKCNCPTFLDTKKKLGEWCKNISFIKINYHEYLRSKTKIDNNEWLKNKTIITRGPNGCDFGGKNYPTKEVSVKDVAGAGDSFLAGLIFKYIHTYNIEESIEFANKCSTQVVQKRGVSIINKNKL